LDLEIETKPFELEGEYAIADYVPDFLMEDDIELSIEPLDLDLEIETKPFELEGEYAIADYVPDFLMEDDIELSIEPLDLDLEIETKPFELEGEYAIADYVPDFLMEDDIELSMEPLEGELITDMGWADFVPDYSWEDDVELSIEPLELDIVEAPADVEVEVVADAACPTHGIDDGMSVDDAQKALEEYEGDDPFVCTCGVLEDGGDFVKAVSDEPEVEPVSFLAKP